MYIYISVSMYVCRYETDLGVQLGKLGRMVCAFGILQLFDYKYGYFIPLILFCSEIVPKYRTMSPSTTQIHWFIMFVTKNGD